VKGSIGCDGADYSFAAVSARVAVLAKRAFDIFCIELGVIAEKEAFQSNSVRGPGVDRHNFG
jgi:hypothetical protein